jgi:chromosome segregation ATPase
VVSCSRWRKGAYRLYRGVVDARNDEAEAAQHQLAEERAAHQHELANEQAAHEETRRRAEDQRAELEQAIAHLEGRLRLRNELVAFRNQLQQNIDAMAATPTDALNATFSDRARERETSHLRYTWVHRLEEALRAHGLPDQAAEFRFGRAELRAVTSRQHLLDAYMDRRDLLDRLLQPDHELWKL